MKSLTYLLHGSIFAFGSAIILYGVVNNLNTLIHPADILPPILFSILSFFAFVVLAYWLTHSLESAGLIASLLVLGLFHLWSVFLTVLAVALISLLVIKIRFKRIRSTDIHLVLTLF